MTKIFRYVLDSDAGMAPNPRGDFLSLATCKPVIRRVAKEGDFVVGVFPSPNNDVVAWVGMVSEKLEIGEYYHRHRDREDALYQKGADGVLRRVKGKLRGYHPDESQQKKDRSGSALVFDNKATWYFGGSGRQLPPSLSHLAARGQGHRVNGLREGDPERFAAWIASLGPPSRSSPPRHGWWTEASPNCSKPKQARRRTRRTC